MAKQKKAQEVSAVRQAKHGWIITLLFAVLSILWISPIFMVLLNSFKRKAYIFKHPFGISTVFMFTGFVKSISLEIEEAAMIDGCTPLQMYFRVVFPILRPTAVTVAILEAMWVWNDYLLPSLVLNINQYKTIPIAIQYLKQSHGMIDWGAMMAMLVLAILPIVIFYIVCQKYIIEGVLAGAVKG